MKFKHKLMPRALILLSWKGYPQWNWRPIFPPYFSNIQRQKQMSLLS